MKGMICFVCHNMKRIPIDAFADIRGWTKRKGIYMKKNFAKILALVLVASMVFAVMAGCQKAEEDLNVCIASEPNTIDPQLNTSVDGATLINHAFEGLMKINSDNEVVEAQAASYAVNDDGTVYTFTLRDDIKWSDGEPVTASDFVYAWQRLVDPATASEYNYMLDMVENANEIMAGDMEPSTLGVKAIDEKNV